MQLANAWPFFKSAWLAAKKQALLTDRSFLSLFTDIVRCKFKYGTALSDYLLFNFMEFRDPKMREEYIFAKGWMQLVHNLNPPNDTPGFITDKVLAYKRFKKYFYRDVLVIADSSDDDICAFCDKHSTFYAKRALSYAGRDVEKIKVDPDDIDQAITYVRERYDMLEEEIVQHPLLDTVSPSAVASFRFTVLKYQGRILILPLSVRIALWDDVDIIKMGQSSSCVAIDEEGRFISPAVVNDSLFDPAFETRYDHHPLTGVAISDGSFQVPFFKEMVDMVMEITEGEDEYGHIGWDIAVSDKGPCVIEGNPWGHYDFYQYYDHVKRTMQGIRPTIEQFMGGKIRDLPKK